MLFLLITNIYLALLPLFINYYFLEEEIVIYCIIIFFETKALTKHIDRKKEPTKNKDVLPIPEKET